MPLGLKDKVTFTSNDIHMLNSSILEYIRGVDGFYDIASVSDSLLKGIVYNWSISVLGKRYLDFFNKRHMVGITLPDQHHSWSLTIQSVYEDSSSQPYTSSNINQRSDIVERGVLGLIMALLRYLKSLSSDMLAKTAGSAEGDYVSFVITVRALRPPNHPLRCGLVSDKILTVTGRGVVTLCNPDHGYSFCGANVMKHVLLHCRRIGVGYNDSYMIPDSSITGSSFIKHVEALISSRVLLKTICIYELVATSIPDRFTFKTCIKGVRDSRKVCISVVYNTHHLWVLQPKPNKRPAVMSCDYCNVKNIRVASYEKHVVACKIKASRSVPALSVGGMEYNIRLVDSNVIQGMDTFSMKLVCCIEECVFTNNTSVCVIGPGGNGKTFLNTMLLERNPTKLVVVLSPTGIVAADYPGVGTTWQRYTRILQLLMGTNQYTLLNNRSELKKRLQKEWKDMVRPDLIIIEEVSMISGSDLRFMSICFGIYYDVDLVWGGIPISYCGDPGQLTPVLTGSKLIDSSFTSHLLQQVCGAGNCFQLDHPRRLIHGCTLGTTLDIDRLLIETNLLLKLRMGFVDPELLLLLQTHVIRDDGVDSMFSDLLSDNFNTGDDVMVCCTNKVVTSLVGRKYNTPDSVRFGTGSSGVALFLSIGMRMIITDNWAIDDPRVMNGTDCIIVNFCVGKWVELQFCFSGEIVLYRLQRGSGFISKTSFALGYYYIRTIHKSQGMTVKGRVYIYINGADTKISVFQPGAMYVAISRCTTLQNVHFISNRSISDILSPSIVHHVRPMLAFMSDPDGIAAQDVFYNSNNGFYLNDSSSINGQVVAKNKCRVTKDGQHADRFILENESIYNNTLNIDHETGIRVELGKSKHQVVYSPVLWIFSGRIDNFKSFLERNGGSIEGLEPYTLLPRGHMQFSWLEMEHPMKSLTMWISRIISLIETHIRNDTLTEFPEVAFFHNNPMVDLGYNNLGFDFRFFLQDILYSSNELDIDIIKGSGSDLKSFTISFSDGYTAYSVYDLMQCSGVGSLSSKTKSYIDPLLGDATNFYTLHGKLWNVGIDPTGVSLHPEWYNISIDDKCELLNQWYLANHKGSVFQTIELYNTFMRVLESHNTYARRVSDSASTFVKRCQIAGVRDCMLYDNATLNTIRKGCVPLKYISTLTRAQYIASVSIDLISIMTTPAGIDWSICFFDREISMAKQMHNDDSSIFKNYRLLDEIQSYGQSDICLNYMLASVLNNRIYKYGNGLAGCEFFNSWNGLRLSLFAFPTTASLSRHMMMITLPAPVVHTHPFKNFIHTKIPHYPLCLDESIKCVSGGKVQARRCHFVSTDGGVNDYYSYQDVSGMYMKIQQESMYPYGAITLYDSTESMDNFLSMFNNKTGDIFTKCRIFKIRATHNPFEIENVLAFKKSDINCYSSKTNDYHCTHAELAVLSMYGVVVHCIYQVIEWEFQSKLFETIMKFYDCEKTLASQNNDPVGRNIAKLLANSTFGMSCKSDKNTKMVIIGSPEQMDIVQTKYSGGLINELDCGNYLIASVEDVDQSISTNPSYLGRFTLGYSKYMLYHAIHKAYGDLRLSPSILPTMIQYGDTDSIVIHKTCIDRLIEYDSTVDVCEQLLFFSGSDSKYKSGKFTDELADDVAKYTCLDYSREISCPSRGFPHVGGYHPRIIHAFNPQSKSGGNRFIFPPLYWGDGRKTTFTDYPQPDEQEWISGYKCFLKGVSINSALTVCPLADTCTDGLTIVPSGVAYLPPGVRFSKECFDFLEYCYKWNLSFYSKRAGSIIKRYLFLNHVDISSGIEFCDVVNEPDVGRNVWGSISNGRILVLKPEFRTNPTPHYSTLILNGYTMYDISDGICVPHGYPLDMIPLE